jgi:TM2 domain-containing membrane protein YozV
MKSRKTAILLAVVGGGVGVHKFYLNDSGSGIFYIMLTVFSAALGFPIGWILGWIDAFAFMTMSDERFDKKYNSGRRGQRGRRRNESNNPYERKRQNSYDKSKGRQDRRSRPVSRRRKKQIVRDNLFKNSGIKKLKDFELDLALEDLLQALELSPDDKEIHFALGQVYSMTEKKEKSYYHISKAVQLGFNDYNKIRTTDELAYLRVQDGFERFDKGGFLEPPSDRNVPDQKTTTSNSELKEEVIKDDLLLSQLQKLSELRKKGLLSESEFLQEKVKLMRR